jgi:hypothetical protein
MKPDYVEHKDRAARIQSAFVAIKAIVPLDLYTAHKKELISVCVWIITEADGKSKVRYWSEGAVSNQADKLQHEHVHERKVLIARLLSGEAVESVVADAIACMVTKNEHQKLGASSSLGWQRYRDAGIRVYDAKEKLWRW